MVVTAFMGSLQARAIDEAGGPLRTGLPACTGSLPHWAVVEEGVVQCLNIEQGHGGLSAGSDPGQMAEILESLDAGSDHDQQIGV